MRDPEVDLENDFIVWPTLPKIVQDWMVTVKFCPIEDKKIFIKVLGTGGGINPSPNNLGQEVQRAEWEASFGTLFTAISSINFEEIPLDHAGAGSATTYPGLAGLPVSGCVVLEGPPEFGDLTDASTAPVFDPATFPNVTMELRHMPQFGRWLTVSYLIVDNDPGERPGCAHGRFCRVSRYAQYAILRRI